MKKLRLEEIAYPALTSGGIGERNTISNGPDDNTLNLDAARFANPARHGSTQQAIDNALALSGGALNVCGHGNTGLLETGMGQTGPFDANKLIYLYNESWWGPQLDRIAASPIPLISIWSCHTGEGQDGADLLYAMALHAKRAVRAGTGFLYVNQQNLWWENGSQWQAATPDHKPNPIPAPSPHSFAFNALFEVEEREHGVEDVRAIEVRSFTTSSKNAPVRLDGAEAQIVIGRLFGFQAIEMSASVSGLVTSQISIEFASGGKLLFDVINDRLALNRNTRTAYYVHSIADWVQQYHQVRNK
jgi:hypothetical protein